jgi:hypothetical protein
MATYVAIYMLEVSHMIKIIFIMVICYPIGKRIRDLPPCKAVPQPFALPHTALSNTVACKIMLQDRQVSARAHVYVYM